LGDEIEKNEMGGHMVRMGDKRDAFRSLVGRLREMAHLEDLSVGGRIRLK
jgi:hypothetical protein